VLARTHKVLGHDLDRRDLPFLGHFLDLNDELLLLVLEVHALAVQLSDRAVDLALVLAELLLHRLLRAQDIAHCCRLMPRNRSAPPSFF
jgi:hypothetical protein